jgi:hypothetical protein
LAVQRPHNTRLVAAAAFWRTFLRNHAPDIAAMDLFVVPTIGFDLFFVFASSV